MHTSSNRLRSAVFHEPASPTSNAARRASSTSVAATQSRNSPNSEPRPTKIFGPTALTAGRPAACSLARRDADGDPRRPDPGRPRRLNLAKDGNASLQRRETELAGYENQV